MGTEIFKSADHDRDSSGRSDGTGMNPGFDRPSSKMDGKSYKTRVKKNYDVSRGK